MSGSVLPAALIVLALASCGAKRVDDTAPKAGSSRPSLVPTRALTRCRPLLDSPHRSGACARGGKRYIVGARGNPVTVGSTRVTFLATGTAKVVLGDDEPDSPPARKANGTWLRVEVTIEAVGEPVEVAPLTAYGNRLSAAGRIYRPDLDVSDRFGFRHRSACINRVEVHHACRWVLAYDVDERALRARHAVIEFMDGRRVRWRLGRGQVSRAKEVGVLRVRLP